MSRRSGQRSHSAPSANNQRGQATLEFALLLPVFVLLALFGIQVSMVGLDWLRVQHAARESARQGAVAVDDPQAAAQQSLAVSSGLRANRYNASVSVSAELVVVRLDYTSDTNVPVVGRLVPSVKVSSTVTMYREPDMTP